MQLKPGTLLQNGKYKILRTLGQGGFGITYEAEHTILRKTVAIKEFFMKDICNREMETSLVTTPSEGSKALASKFKDKFIKEARTIWGLQHPHIVRVTDVFEENGTAYYVMENMTGGSLKGKVEADGPLSESDAEHYIRQVADALAYIHSENMVHLDVKPSNILLNTKGEAILIDFGISKHYDNAGEQTSSTPVGLSKGFAPLEQGRDGDVSQFRPSTDIYALGATLYYLVSGKVPPEASIVNEDGLSRPQGVSDRIWNAIEQAMQPRRKDRPQDIAAFLSLLDSKTGTPVIEDIVDDEKTGVPLPKTPEPVPEPAPMPEQTAPPAAPRKNGLKPILACLATLAAIAAVVLGTRTCNHLSEANSINDHEYVDLGLSVKWATCNVGASSPSDCGSYFAWGETRPKSDYSWNTLAYCLDPKGNGFSKYNTKSDYGTVDNKSCLDLSDDAAHANWGGTWRMPTEAEKDELRNKCTWTWTSQGGRNGYLVTSKTNGNSIFLPAAGYRDGTSLDGEGSAGRYWSSSLDRVRPYYASNLRYDSDSVGEYCSLRRMGFSVRPVSE